jgi:hypothetical protein
MELSIPCRECLEEKMQHLAIFGFPPYKDNYDSSMDRSGKIIKLVQYGLERENRVQHLT